MKLIVESKTGPKFRNTNRFDLEDGPEAYETPRDKADGCVKVVIRPSG
jgi:threonine dehydrogenase-like Zn-dependent dehydrogenase